MPYMRDGAQDQRTQVRSPLLNINRACQTCHKFPEAELKARVEQIQERNFKLRNEAMDAADGLIGDIKAAKAEGERGGLAAAHEHQRKAQFRLDFIEAENSMGFHAPQEAARMLGMSIEDSRRARRPAIPAPGTPAAAKP